MTSAGTPAGESVLSDSWVEHVEQALCERPVDAATLESTLRNLLSAMQRVNGQRAFGICRQCARFLTEETGGTRFVESFRLVVL